MTYKYNKTQHQDKTSRHNILQLNVIQCNVTEHYIYAYVES